MLECKQFILLACTHVVVDVAALGTFFLLECTIFSNHWMQQFSYTHESHTFQQRVLFFLLYAQMTTLHLTMGYMYVWSHVLFAPQL